MDKLLGTRWQRFWGALNVPGATSGLAFERLFDSYTEPHRGYHGIEHIQYCLETFDSVRHLAIFPNELEAAIWWHDVAYNPRAADNEHQSQLYAFAECALMRMPHSFTERVGDYIMATTHKDDQTVLDQQIICDIDLSSLGADSWDVVCANSRGIRKEYRHVPEANYIEGRTKILQGFLTRERLFYTHHFRTRFEGHARRNIEREILVLPELARLPD